MEQFVYIGLGNDAPHFAGTRHNLGIETLREWMKMIATHSEYRMSAWREQKDYQYHESRITNHEYQVHCLFPTTMMNESGQAVAAYLQKNPVPLSQVLVIHDDVELPFGEVRLVTGGSAKGHKGVRSIQQALNAKEFQRLRLGIGRPPEGVSLNEFVLGKFLPEEKETVQKMITTAVEMLSNKTLPPDKGD